MRVFVILSVFAAACAPTLKTYKPDSMAREEGAVIGRVKVVYNEKDLTSQCMVCFRSVNGSCFQMDQSGFVALALRAGGCSIRRIACDVDGERHFDFKGLRFEVAPLAKTYFGDIKIDWRNDQGFKVSQLFGAVGAIVDQSTNDGEAKLSMIESRGEILGWYDQFVQHKDGLPLRESLVAYSAAPPMLSASSCAPLAPVRLVEGAEVRAKPDHESAILPHVPIDAPACAGDSVVGYGYRRVRWPGGVEGYALDDDIRR